MDFLAAIGLYLSQGVNFLCGGEPDESLSARAKREGRTEWVRWIDKVFGVGHCARVLTAQRKRQLARFGV
jgi:hypothetical protein